MSKQNEKSSKIEIIYVQDLIPYEKNPKKHGKNVDALVESIKEFGWTSPIIIDQKNRIVAGHGRRLAALQLNLSTVPCIRVELTDDEYLRLMMVDNRVAELSKWHKKHLQEAMTMLGDLANLQIPGFTIQDIDKIFGHKHEDVSFTDDAEADFGDGQKVDSSEDERALVKRKTFMLSRKEYKFADEKLKAVKKEHGFDTEAEAFLEILKGVKSLAKVVTKKSAVKEIEVDDE